MNDISLVLKILGKNQINHLVCCHKDAFGQEAWNENFFLSLLNLPTTLALGVFKDQAEDFLMGLLFASHVEKEMEILTFCVRSSLRNKGVGGFLLNEFLTYGSLKGVKRCFLEVAENNVNAITLYKKMGFKIYGCRKNYYDTPGKEPTNALLLVYEK